MISANSLLFPKPNHSKFPPSIERSLVYLPKVSPLPLSINTDQNNKNQDITKTSYPETARSTKINLSTKKRQTSTIPCLYFQGTFEKQKLIIYFHGNAEDLVTGYDLIKTINCSTGKSVLAVEYPGYSVYKNGNKCDANVIQEDSKNVIQNMREKGFEYKDMTIMGRSIGSGVAVHLATKYPVGHLILISPFLSICQIVKDLYCSLVSWLLKDRFDNKERIKEIKCPCLIIHGISDEIIPYQHSISLNAHINGNSMLKLVNQMTHSSFHYQKDFLNYVKEFYTAF